MSWHHLFNWLPSRSSRRTRRAPTPVLPWHFVRPRLERLESRIVPVVVTPFTPVFSANVTGDIAITGNTLETASTVNNPGRTATDVTNAQNGTGFNDNNDWNMAYVNVNTTTPGLFDSSTAALNLPTGATVLFAGLYWLGDSTGAPNAALRSQVLFSTPTSGGSFTTINGTIVGDSSAVTPAVAPAGANYEGYANVTSLVQDAGNGNYTVAKVQSALGTNLYAGWSLVVAYQAPGAAPRNLTIFNGYATVGASDPPLNIPISGFIAPPSGTVTAEVGVVAGEGDLGITGDSMELNGKNLSDALNAATNFFDSVISNQGVYITAKNPNYVDQLGFDAKIVNVPSGVIANSATSATVTLTTSGDGYFPGVVTTSIPCTRRTW
jgi:large repetitive protein